MVALQVRTRKISPGSLAQSEEPGLGPTPEKLQTLEKGHKEEKRLRVLRHHGSPGFAVHYFPFLVLSVFYL